MQQAAVGVEAASTSACDVVAAPCSTANQKSPLPPSPASSTATSRSGAGGGQLYEPPLFAPGGSERYPLGERSLAATGHQQHNNAYHSERFSCQRYADRYTPVQNIGSLDRYHTHVTLDRYCRTTTPTDRYHTLSTDKTAASGDRYCMEKYNSDGGHQQQQHHRQHRHHHGSSQSMVCSFSETRQHRSGSRTDVYKVRERSASSDRKHQYHIEQQYDRYSQADREDRFPTIPCPERFATKEKPDTLFSAPPPPANGGYLEPPSPAPVCANDRRFLSLPAPALSSVPGNTATNGRSTPSPDCFANTTFPSPQDASSVPPPDRFAPPTPPPPLSPTEQYHNVSNIAAASPRKPRYAQHGTATSAVGGDRFHHKERYQNYSERYPTVSHSSYHTEKFVHSDNRYNNGTTSSGERYIPPNAHTPVERYVPQPQEPYYGSSSASYQSSSYGATGFKYNSNSNSNNNDPYMRRDLAYHYRLSLPYNGNHYQRVRYIGTPNRMKCCQLQDYQLSKSSPGSSSSSSSVTSSQGKDVPVVGACTVQDIQCQNYSTGYQQQQEKAVQCGNTAQQQCLGFVSPNMRSAGKVKAVGQQCRHSICSVSSPSVEYLGASGGRHVCATPPPRGSVGSDGGLCPMEGCCAAMNRRQSAITVAVWRAAAAASGSSNVSHPLQTQQQQQQQPRASPSTSADHQYQLIQQQQQQQYGQGTVSAQPPPEPSQRVEDPASAAQAPPTVASQRVQRAVSMPSGSQQRIGGDVCGSRTQHRNVGYSQSERLPNRERPTLNRSLSRKEIIKNYIKKETANFFGVDEDNENEQQLRWLDRRKRMACRTMGPLKDEYCLPVSTSGTVTRLRHRRAVSEMSGIQTNAGQRPDVLPTPGGEGDFTDAPPSTGSGSVLRRKHSVARMTWDGLSYVVTTLTRHRPRPRSQQTEWSRSYPPDSPVVLAATAPDAPEEQGFFDEPASAQPPAIDGGEGDAVDRGQGQLALPAPAQIQQVEPPGTSMGYRDAAGDRFMVFTAPHHHAKVWKRDHDDVVLRHGEHRARIGESRILSNTVDHVLDNSNRRRFGMGLVGRLFGRSFRKSVTQDAKLQEQLDDMEDYRPMFTYWVTTVQILVLFISVICYGFGPFGFDLQTRSGQVLVTSLSLQQVDYMEPANFWFGPRASDLIHLGAKFAPCMRVDTKIKKEIDKIQAKERETACCIRNDDSGCVQSSQADCSKTISTWKKWTMGDAGPGGRISGSVCGLDPKFCDAPASVHPYEWPDDITKWPICRKTNTQFSIQTRPKDKLAEHMVCEVIGHPCCIGIHGQCKITTKEYCDFVRGTFHEEASLCSQVSCLNDVCGMIPFYFPNVPDQFYRLWTSLFLHAGVLQLLVTVLIQYFLMRDLEKLTGSVRIGIIYIGSGVAGNLASAIFVPYRADVGPAGSQFGLLACLIVEVLNAWPMLRHPNRALGKLLSVTMVLFLLGLLPWVDNYAHLFGFAFGFLLSYAFLPFVSFGRYDRHKKIFLIWVCLASAWILFICLVLLFYIIPVYDCKICSYFNCLPITRDFCASQNINFKREEPIV